MNKYKNRSNISGKVIQNSRIEHNLSLEKLSNKLELLGVTLYNSDISRIENQTLFVRDYEQKAICKVLNISCEQLYENTDKYFS